MRDLIDGALEKLSERDRAILSAFYLQDFKELHHIGIECSKCKTTTVLDIENPRLPLTCPSCEKPFYEGMADTQNPIHRLVAALKAVVSSNHRFTAYIAGAPLQF